MHLIKMQQSINHFAPLGGAGGVVRVWSERSLTAYFHPCICVSERSVCWIPIPGIQ